MGGKGVYVMSESKGTPRDPASDIISSAQSWSSCSSGPPVRRRMAAPSDNSGERRKTLLMIGGGDTFVEDLYAYI